MTDSGQVRAPPQRPARVRDLVGEERDDPDWDPAKFVDPNEIGGPVVPNPYSPLIPGTQWVLEGGGETVTIVVTDRTKLIDGVDCRVVNDVVEVDGELVDEEGNRTELVDFSMP